MAEQPNGGRTLCMALDFLGWDVCVGSDGNGGFLVTASQLGRATHAAEHQSLNEAALAVYLKATKWAKL